MNDDRQRRLVVVKPAAGTADPEDEEMSDGITAVAARDTDWAILMARAQDGDATAYLRLLREITPYLKSIAQRWHKDRWDVEDTVQDILLTLHSIRHTYDPSRPFGPWLVGIANRRAIDRLRRRGRHGLRETPLDAEHEAFAGTAPALDDAIGKRHLQGAIDDLPPIQKQAIHLLKLKQMSLKEASIETGLSVASLKMATHRALKNLRAMLSDRRDC